MKSRLPLVALVGQTNAGKSSILNRMARKNIAIVAREEGTTRDAVAARIDDAFVLVDTAGLKEPSDDFEASIQEQIADAIEAAAVILVVLDSTKYFDERDRRVAKEALRSGKPVFLVLNKADRRESLPIEEFRALGVAPEQTVYVSATTGQNIGELREMIGGALARGFFPEPVALSRANSSRGVVDESSGFVNNPGSGCAREPGQSASVPGETMRNAPGQSSDAAVVKLALIGRPNVGKSSLFNALSQKQQAIVSSRQGTTRDVNRVEVRYKGQDLEILDTAGLRRQGKREVGIEQFSALRTLAAIEEADVCALLVDATEPHVKLDQTLAGQIVEAGKGIIVVVTKADLLKNTVMEEHFGARSGRKAAKGGEAGGVGEVNGAGREEAVQREAGRRGAVQRETGQRGAGQRGAVDTILDQLERDFDFLPFAPVVVTSATTGENVTQLFELACEIAKARRTKIKTAELNKILGDAVLAHPPAGLKNTRPKPKYMVQTDVCPPWFVVHGRDLGLLHWSWKRFLERKLREKYPLVGVPVMISYRDD